MASPQLGVPIAGALGRADSARERSFTLRLAAAGALRFLFLPPELLELALPVLHHARTRLARVVIDEAHLVSAWGVRAATTHTTPTPQPQLLPSTSTPPTQARPNPSNPKC